MEFSLSSFYLFRVSCHIEGIFWLNKWLRFITFESIFSTYIIHFFGLSIFGLVWVSWNIPSTSNWSDTCFWSFKILESPHFHFLHIFIQPPKFQKFLKRFHQSLNQFYDQLGPVTNNFNLKMNLKIQAFSPYHPSL